MSNTFYTASIELAYSLGQLTGTAWQANASKHHPESAAYLTERDSGISLYLHVDWQKHDRINISYDVLAEHKDFNWYNDPRLGITVGRARTAKQVAAEIARRLLPDVRPFHAELTSRYDNHNSHESALQSLATQMARSAGKDASTVRKEGRHGHTGFDMAEKNRHSKWYARHAEVSVSVNGDDKGGKYQLVDIGIGNLRPDEAERVLALLRTIITD